MVTLQQVRVSWNGFIGAPGVSTFYTELPVDPEAFQVVVKDFFEAIAIGHPSDITWTVENEGVTLDEDTGQPNGTWSGEGGGDVEATGPDQYSAPVGWLATWHTGFFTGGRELKGRTFFVPMSSEYYDGNGDIGGESLDLLQGACDDFILAGNPVIYSPTTHGSATVSTAKLPKRPSVLRSRRD